MWCQLWGDTRGGIHGVESVEDFCCKINLIEKANFVKVQDRGLSTLSISDRCAQFPDVMLFNIVHNFIHMHMVISCLYVV